MENSHIEKYKLKCRKYEIEVNKWHKNKKKLNFRLPIQLLMKIKMYVLVILKKLNFSTKLLKGLTLSTNSNEYNVFNDDR